MANKLYEDIAGLIPHIFEDYIELFNVRIERTGPESTSIIGKNYALIFSMERQYPRVMYARRYNDHYLTGFFCDNYFAEKYTDEDRQDLIPKDQDYASIFNELYIIHSGLKTKWSNVLNGDDKWMEGYRKSRWFARYDLKYAENSVISRYI